MPADPSPADFTSGIRSALGTAGPPGEDAIGLIRTLRSTLAPAVPPPPPFVGDRAEEARWWWAQALAVLGDALAFSAAGLLDAWLEAVRRAIELAGRAVDTCPAEHPDRPAMARFAADVVLDACELAPWLIGPQLPEVLALVRRHCAHLSATESATRQVRALPLTIAAGGSVAEALMVLDGASVLLRGEPVIGPTARATRSMARLLSELGDGDRALALLAEVEAGIDLTLQARPASDPPPWLAAALADVRAGRAPAPLDVDSLTGRQVREGQAALAATSDLVHERWALTIDRAMCHLDLGRLAEAEALFTQLLELPDPALRAQAQMMRGIVRLERGDHEAAAVDVEGAVARVGDEGRLGWPLVAYARARICAGRGRPETDQAFAFATHLTADTGIAWRTWAARAGYQASRTPTDAIESYRNMAAAITRLRRSTLGYRLDNTSLQDKAPHVAAAVHLGAAQQDWAATLELIETFKARELQAILADRTAGVGPPGDRLAFVERRLDALEFGAVLSPDENTRRSELAALRAERVLLLEREEWRHSASGGLTPPTVPPVDLIVAETTVDGRVAIDLHLDLAASRLTAVGLRDGHAAVGVVDLPSGVVNGVLRRAANLRSTSPDSLLYDPRTTPALTLDDLLPAEVLELLDGATHLTVSPHGPLHLVAWPAMAWRGQRLLERVAVSVAPSLWSLALLGSTSPVPTAIVAFGAPEGPGMPPLGAIPGAGDELRAVVDQYAAVGLPATATTGAQATETAIRARMAQPIEPGAVLHLACHAMTGPDGAMRGRPFLDGPEDPLAAGLVLADGVLNADEIRRVRSPFAEVVLSACSTGWRPTEVASVGLIADSALGLVASFMQAGAGSVVASVPIVDDDAACVLLQRYHENRLRALPPATALCTAQRDLLAEGRFDATTIVGFAVHGR